MAELYRRGRKSVHAAPVIGGVRRDVNDCNLDLIPGGTWGPVIPAGDRCAVCFAGLGDERQKRQQQAQNAAASGVAAVAVVAAVLLWSPSGTEPVTAYSSPLVTFTASASEALLTFTPVPTGSPAAPSAVPGMPSQTPAPSVGPGPTAVSPAPVPTPLVIFVPVEPESPTPSTTPNPSPAPTCFHPGHNLGVDECRWPHN